jgi:hypothetical protein
MQGPTTKITNPAASKDEKKFTFDYSYWSHDGCKDDGTGYMAPDTSHPNGKKFADQVYSFHFQLICQKNMSFFVSQFNFIVSLQKPLLNCSLLQ